MNLILTQNNLPKKNLKIFLSMFYIRLKKKIIEKMSESLISSFLVSNVSESLRELTKNERCERIAQVDHQK